MLPSKPKSIHQALCSFLRGRGADSTVTALVTPEGINIPTSTGALGCNCTDVATPGSMWGLSPHLLGGLFQCIQSTSCFLLASLMNTELSRSWANVILCRTCKYSTCSRLPHDRTEPTQPGEGLCLCTEICPLCSMLPLSTFPDVREKDVFAEAVASSHECETVFI